MSNFESLTGQTSGLPVSQLRKHEVASLERRNIPGPVDQKYRELLKVLAKVEGEPAELTWALELLDEVQALFREQQAILRKIVA